MAERLCINEAVAEASSGKAICSKSRNKYRADGCFGCPRPNNDLFPILADLRSKEEKLDSAFAADRAEHIKDMHIKASEKFRTI